MENQNNNRYTSLATRLSIAIVIMATIVFVIALSIFFAYANMLVKDEAIKRAEAVLDKTITRIENVLNETEVAVDNLEPVIYKVQKTPDSMFRITSRFVSINSFIWGSTVAFEPYYYKDKGELFAPYSYREGGIVLSTQIGNDDYQYHFMDWYLIPKLLKESYWSEPYYDEGGANIIMTTYSKLLYNEDNDMIGVITADISLNWLTEIVDAERPYPNSYSIMIGRGGSYIVHKDRDKIFNETVFTAAMEMSDTNAIHIGKHMVAGDTGNELLKIDDKLAYVFYAPIKNTGWSVAIVCPYDDVLLGVFRMRYAVIFTVVIGLLLLLLFCSQVVKRITKPLTQFASTANKIAGGDFNVTLPKIYKNKEMVQLHNSFEFMQDSLKRYMDELKKTTSIKERIESELRIASDIQMGMIPKIFPPFPDRDDINVFATLHPAKEVGGDLYDFFIDNNKFYFAIGDVSGKGVPASLFMAVTRSIFRSIATYFETPGQIMKSMNDSMEETNDSNLFVTLFIGILDLGTGKLSYCNAGHNPPIISTPDGQVKFMDIIPNLPAGLFGKFEYKEQELQLPRGASIFMYTDGLTESESVTKTLFGEARLLEEIKKLQGKEPQEVTTTIVSLVKEHAVGAEQNDDLTILTIKFK